MRPFFSYSSNIISAVLAALLLSIPVLTAWVTIPYVKAASTNVQKNSSSAITLTPDGAILLVVNPDSNSLTLVDTAIRSVMKEITVGIDPRCVAVDPSGYRAYVTNRLSDSLSAIDLLTQTMIAQVKVGHQPYGVVVSPSGNQLYVAEQGSHQVRILDANTLKTLAILPTIERPSGLAISADGRTLYVTHLLTNAISILTVQPYQNYQPVILNNTAEIGTEHLSDSTIRLHNRNSTPAINSFFQSALLLWPDSNLIQSIVIAPDGKRAFIPHTRSNTTNQVLAFDSTVFPVVSQVDLATRQHLIGQQFDMSTLDPPGVGLPFDASFMPSGEQIWVVNAASNNVTVIDLPHRRLVAHIPVGDNPRGIILSTDGSTAYVNNTLAGTVSVIDTAAYTVTAVITTTDIPLPPVLLKGKRLFNSSADPRMARVRWISCNTCHFEGEQDGRTWFFSFAGPRNTTSLLGMIQTYPLRWSGEWNESADAEFAIRKQNFGSGLINGAMNCSLLPPDCVNQPPNQGRSLDLDALATFIDSLQAPFSPNHLHGEPLNEAEQRGQTLFLDPGLKCITCHPPPTYTDHLKHDVGTATTNERIGPAYDTPTLNNLYNSAPYFHDGSAATLYEAITRPSSNSEHDLLGMLSNPELQDLISYLLALPFTH